MQTFLIGSSILQSNQVKSSHNRSDFNKSFHPKIKFSVQINQVLDMHLLHFFYPGFLFISYMNLFRFFFRSHQWRAPFLCTRPFHGPTNTITFSGRKSFSQRESLRLRLKFRLMLSTTKQSEWIFFESLFQSKLLPFRSNHSQ